MTDEPAARSLATAQLRITAPGTELLLQVGASYRIGRDPLADIVLTDPRVSWQHATLQHEDGSWVLQDASSTNGMFLGRQRVQQVVIAADCTIRLGHPDNGPTLTCAPLAAARHRAGSGLADGADAQAPPPGALARPGGAAQQSVPGQRGSLDRPPSLVLQLPVRVLRVGRAEGNDVVIPDLSVSRFHAELRRTAPDHFEIVDLASHNGTYLNGQRVFAAPVSEADLIGIGPATFRLVGGHLQEFVDTGDITLAAWDLSVRLPGGKVLLDHISFALGERCLLGVIGPSGAGKSTLLGALTGIQPATEGRMLYDGRDLYQHYAELRHRIGLVPQENILHGQLSARRALRFAAELRFPRDTRKDERERRIDEVLAELGLTKHSQTRTSALSGGQQKRVNVALELLTRPSLLFLDEPTSGLDPGLDKSVMEMMAGLAHDGRTVVVVTHSVANLDLCDRLLVLVPGGRVAFFGPPADGLRHFGKPGWAEVFQAFDAEPDRDWPAEFRESAYHRRYVTAELGAAAAPARAAPQARRPHAARNKVAQFVTMCRRYLALISADRVFLAALAITPLLLGLLTRAVPAPLGLTGTDNAGAQSLLLVTTIGACFTGAANSVRELVKERAIFARERAAGLSAGAYLAAKLVILGAISAVQSVILLAVGLLGRPLPARGALFMHFPLLELLLAIAALAITSMALGLFISALVNSSDKTMPLLVVSVMCQVVLSGGIFPLHGKAGLNQLSWLSPSRWGYAATAATTNLNRVLPAATPAAGGASGHAMTTISADPLWDHTAGTWATDIGILLALGAVFAALTWWRLVRMGPARRR